MNLYTYCHNDPVEFVDPSGHIVETVVDIASIGWSAYDMWNDPSWANAGYLAWDIAATLVPIAPGSYVVKAPKAAAKALSKADDAKKARKGAVKMDLQLFADDISKAAKGILKEAQLPTTGKIRYVPPKKWTASQPLPRQNGGYIDKFGNIWTRGPSRTKGQAFEWDVQLSKTGKEQLGWASRDGSHLNISLDGRITHK